MWLQRLVKYKCLKAIEDSVRKQNYRTRQVGIPELRHFLYKSRSAAQFSSPAYEAPYTTEEDRARLFGLYQYLHHRIHSTARPLKILFHVGAYETLLGWVSRLMRVNKLILGLTFAFLAGIWMVLHQFVFFIVQRYQKRQFSFDQQFISIFCNGR